MIYRLCSFSKKKSGMLYIQGVLCKVDPFPLMYSKCMQEYKRVCVEMRVTTAIDNKIIHCLPNKYDVHH